MRAAAGHINRAGIANRAAIAKPKGKKRIAYPSGTVGDIIDEIMRIHLVGVSDTKKFAWELKGGDQVETAGNIHAFIRSNIRYEVDPIGLQIIKTPAVTNRDGFGDCKAYSLFTASLLENLGIPYLYRFAGYGEEKKPSHVYIVAIIGGKEYPLDACLARPFTEKIYSINIDKMPQIISLSGVNDLVTTPWNFDPQTTTEGQMELYIMRERLELEKQILENQVGISGPKELYKAYDETLSQLNQAISMIEAGNIGLASISGFLQKIGQAVKKVGTAVKKVVTAPALLPIQLAVKLLLPKAAPFFLYLFITDEKTLSKVNPAVRVKRKKAESVMKFMVKHLGMNETILMGLVRNGIMNTYKKTPEQIILAGMEGRLSGIGAFPLALIEPVIKIIQTIAQLFQKKEETPAVSTNDLPDPEKELFVPNKVDVTQYTDQAKKQTTTLPILNNPALNPVTDRQPAYPDQTQYTSDGGAASNGNNNLLVGGGILAALAAGYFILKN